MSSLDVLVVAPHPDDAEISVGGTILKCREAGMTVGVLDLTDGEPTPHGSVQTRQRETEQASAVLGLEFRENLGLPNRQIEATLAARQSLANVFRRVRPRIVLAPFSLDAHPDHVEASRLVDAAVFWSKLTRTDEPGQLPLDGEPFLPSRVLYYWSIHLRSHVRPAFVVDISDVIDQKMQAIECYASQVSIGRSTTHPTVLDDIRDRARYWGWSIHAAYGEPFASNEETGVASLASIL